MQRGGTSVPQKRQFSMKSVQCKTPRRRKTPFLIAQLAVMAIFIVLGVFAVKKFRTEPAATEAWRNTKAS